MAILELRDVRYTYQTQYQKVEALRGVTRSFETGQVHAVMGRSGSGKTTLLSLMAGLDLPTGGEVLYDGTATAGLDLQRYRREKAAVIYQSFRLFPLLTVAENVMYPMELRGMKPREARERAAALVDRVGLPAAALDRFPTMLSGGEQQRVAIARALVNSPAVLLADEPSGNLDSHNRDEIHRLFFELRDRLGQTVVIVTHDEHLAAMADRKITMSDGRIL